MILGHTLSRYYEHLFRNVYKQLLALYGITAMDGADDRGLGNISTQTHNLLPLRFHTYVSNSILSSSYLNVFA
jgi:hypothetical protein